MLGGNRHLFTLIALGAAAAGVFVWGVWRHPRCEDALKSLQHENGQSEETAYEGSVTCERDCQVTFGLAPNAETEPDKSKTKENQTCDTTAELDLVQQMVMAHWAIVGALLAMLGLFGVLLTFRESHKVAIIQSRAYVSIAGGRFHFSPSDYTEIEFSITIYNSGQSPALEIEIDGLALLTIFDKARPDTVFRQKVPKLAVYELGGKESIEKDARFVGRLDSWVENLLKNPAEFNFFGLLKYRDLYGEMHEKRFAVGGEIRDKIEDDRGRISTSLKPVHPDNYNDQFEGDQTA